MKFKDCYLIFGSLCWLISLTSIVFNRARYLKLFSLFLLVTISVEWIAWYMARKLHINNLWLYNAYTLIEFCFLPYFYFLITKSDKVKLTIKYFLILYPLFFILNYFFIQTPYVFNTYAYLAGIMFVLFLIGNWYKEVLFGENKIILSREPVFYISCAFFLFFIIEIPYTLLLPYFVTHDLKVAMGLIWVIKILNIILYILLTIAYLCRPQTPRQ